MHHELQDNELLFFNEMKIANIELFIDSSFVLELMILKGRARGTGQSNG